jgi:hypothetical protein
VPLEEGSSVARIGALDAGLYTLTCFDADWNALAAATVEVEAGETGEVDLRLDGQSFSIRVLDPIGSPIPGAIVELRDAENLASGLESSVTDSDGVAHFAPTAVSAFMVLVSHPTGGFLPPTPLRHPRTQEPVDLVWESMAGFVADVQDHGVPLEGLELWVHERQSGVSAVTFGVPESGHYERANIGPGSYFAEPHSAWVWHRRVAFELDDEGTPVHLEFRRLGDLVVKVADPYGNPVAGIAIDLVSDEFGESVADWLAAERITGDTGLVTNGDGEVHLAGLPHGGFSWSAGSQAGSVVVGVGTGALLEVQLVE